MIIIKSNSNGIMKNIVKVMIIVTAKILIIIMTTVITGIRRKTKQYTNTETIYRVRQTDMTINDKNNNSNENNDKNHSSYKLKELH